MTLTNILSAILVQSIKMPLFVSESEAQDRLNASEVIVKRMNGQTVGKPRADKGRPRLTPAMQELLGTMAHLSGKTATANAFGISRVHADNLSKGLDSGPNNPENKELKAKIESNIGKVKDTALEKLMTSLDLITPDKLKGEKPRDLSAIAKDMASIVEKTGPKEATGGNQVQVQIYIPERTKTEQDYPVVDAVIVQQD